MNDTSAPIILGSFEYVSLPDLKIQRAIAKVDTGAYSGAVHCASIKVMRRKADNVRFLRFVPSDDSPHMVETEKFMVRRVKSSNGQIVKRYLIETYMIIRNKRYTVTIGLSDRSGMHREVLIGRRFLRENNMLVDVRINQELDREGVQQL